MIRRLTPLRPSTGTVIPPKVRLQVRNRDMGCIGPRVGMPRECFGQVELDHVRASGGMEMKSPSVPENLVSLCAFHHEMRTLHGKQWRPVLLDYIENATRNLSSASGETLGSEGDEDAPPRRGPA